MSIETRSRGTSLEGRRIVVTRAAEQAAELATALAASGASPVLCPTIRIARPAAWHELDTALDRLDVYDWVVFTSSNGVRAVVHRLEATGRDASALAGTRLAAVGASTARALMLQGLEAAYVPDIERSISLARSLPDVAGSRVLLTRADLATSALADTLTRRGATRVDDLVAYRTVLLPPAGQGLEELRRGVDGITFTSPSTVRGFVAVGPEWTSLLRGAVVATLGPATTEAARGAGMEVDREAAERSMDGLVDAVAAALEHGTTSTRTKPK